LFPVFLLYRKKFSQFWPDKYYFNLYKGFFMEKMTQICQIWKEKNSTIEIYDDVAPKSVIISLFWCLACSQIWLNVPWDCCHFTTYNTKIDTNEKFEFF
jgi:hypothetical protein